MLVKIAEPGASSYTLIEPYGVVSIGTRKLPSEQKPARRLLPGECFTDLSAEAAAVIMDLAAHPVTPPREPKAVPFGANPRFLG
jgi:hypothetical protein